MGTAYSYLIDGSIEEHGWRSVTQYKEVERVKIQDKNRDYWIGDKIDRLYDLTDEPKDISEVITYEPLFLQNFTKEGDF